jgi:hypothetical protein
MISPHLSSSLSPQTFEERKEKDFNMETKGTSINRTD